MDCTHIHWNKCPVPLYHLCKGKEGYPTIALIIVVDHFRRILHVSRGFFGAMNDKQIIYTDEFICEVLNDKYANLKFTVVDENGSIQDCFGGFSIVDGGMLNMSCFVDPMHSRVTHEAVRWSE